ncbi:MAG TPA: SEC-C metal-binding domain-containing protein, partial [Planctomycetota bacterium]|nr:SEC-C metal-binding domain-containing protein [Planctomycetota bacterium]
CDEIEKVHATGQPILVGTASVESSETLDRYLTERKVRHEVLNAKNHEREAHIVARAGERGAITVATNMAGRGTDIKLGGNFEYRLAQALEEVGLEEGDLDNLERIDEIRSKVREQCDQDEAEVLALGGLYVLGTERHEARRIDNQLRGRTGRQGNVGASRFFLSLEDPLMRIFYRDWTRNMMERLGMTEGQAIESKMVSNAIARAQRKVEDRNFEIRKSLLEYDEVMDTQRKTIYGVRQEVLESTGLKDKVMTMIEGSLLRSLRVHAGDPDGLIDWCRRTFGMDLDPEVAKEACDGERPNLGVVMERVQARYDKREAEFGEDLMRRIESYILLNAIDSRWKDHLKAIDSLKVGIGLRGYGQEDPKIAYKKEGTQMFQEELLPAIENEVASLVLRIQVQKPEEPSAEEERASAGAPGDALQPHGMVPSGSGQAIRPGGAVPQQLSPEQLEALKARARGQIARQAMQQNVSASNAFDVMRRRQAQAERAQGASAAPKAQVAKAAEAFEGVGRNDDCPCGSGKKYKKCHGR